MENKLVIKAWPLSGLPFCCGDSVDGSNAEQKKRNEVQKKIVHPSTNKGTLWYAWQRGRLLCVFLQSVKRWTINALYVIFFSPLLCLKPFDWTFFFVCVSWSECSLVTWVESTLIRCCRSRCGLTCLLFWMPPCCHPAKCYHTRHWDNGQNAQQDWPRKQHDRQAYTPHFHIHKYTHTHTHTWGNAGQPLNCSSFLANHKKRSTVWPTSGSEQLIIKTKSMRLRRPTVERQVNYFQAMSWFSITFPRTWVCLVFLSDIKVWIMLSRWTVLKWE